MKAGLPLIALLMAGAAPAAARDAVWTVDGLLRSRAETVSAAPFGPSGPAEDSYVLWRGLASLSFRPDERVTAFAELGFHDQSGRRGGPAPTDTNRFDLHQSWIEARPAAGWSIRFGRQEMALGGGRLVSLRDGPNIRRAFDGVRVDHRTAGLTARAFLLKTVGIERDALDDNFLRGDTLTGIYLTTGPEHRVIDLYYLGLARDDGAYRAGRGKEKRHSVGIRLAGDGPFDYDLEALVQFGSFGNRSIRAWTLASSIGWRLDRLPLRPRVGLKANITSGDGDPDGRRLGTFNPIYPNFSYFNDAAFLSPQNHADLHPNLTLELAERITLGAGASWFWKTERQDAIYRAPGIPVGGATSGRFVASQFNLAADWRPRRATTLRAALIRLDAGGALREAGGQSSTFGMLSIEQRF